MTGDNDPVGVTLGQITMAIRGINAISLLINETAISAHLKAKTDGFENRSKSKDLFDHIRGKFQTILKPTLTKLLQNSTVAGQLGILLKSTIPLARRRIIHINILQHENISSETVVRVQGGMNHPTM